MVSIRKAGRNDAQSIWAVRRAAIENQCPEFYSAETLKQWMGGRMPESFPEKAERSYYVAMLESRVIGAGAIALDSGRNGPLCVAPEYIGTGVGKRLMQYLETLAREASIRRLHLESSLNAVPFYQACGFACLKEAQYQSPRGFSLDCILMEKKLEG